MGTIKNRNGRDLVEAEVIKKKWKEYTKNATKKILMNQIIMVVWPFTQTRHSGV